MTTGLLSPALVGSVRSVQVGRAAPLGPDGVMSAFVKRAVEGPVEVRTLGLEGDEQVDLRVHGGPDKAVYGYAFSSYVNWRDSFPQYSHLFVPGGLGENLTIEGCDEGNVCLGDIVRIGSATLQVSQPRQPCFKFALRFGDITMPRAMVQNGLCGWYYRVLQPGVLAAGHPIQLQERPHPDWSIQRVNRQIVQRRATASERQEFQRLKSQRT
jgi:MOSC domain-containing protein YiiM